MTTEPVSKADELPVAQRLAQHPRWEWRAGMQAVETRYETPHTFRLGRHVKCHSHSHTRAPDLADDATAGIVLGMVRAWAGGRDSGDLMAEWSQNDDDWRVDARRFDPDYIQHAGFGPTLGDAAGACLLACWARDDAQSAETKGDAND